MASTLKETPINLFIKQNDIDNNVLNKDDSSTAYIIYQNNVIQGKYHKLISEFNELKNEKEMLEDDNDRLQKTRTCLQGHVKNEFIKATCYKDLLDNTTVIVNEQMRMFLICNLMSIFYMLIPFMNLTYYYSITLLFTIVSIHSSIIFKTYTKIHKLNTNERILQIKEDIVEIEKASTLIEELVDNF